MSDKLPSIDNLPESELPSVDEFIKEEKELPSIDEFVETEEEVIEEPPDTAPCSIEEEAQDLTEIVRLINDVRKDIPDIPEIKYYDEELEKLIEQVEEVRNSIPELPEIKYYDDEIASLREEINQNAADIPEIKYYDEQVNDLEEKVNVIKEAIVSLPEPKYYEADLESLKEDILAVKQSIPEFPKWVNEVNQVPDFSWIGKTFGVIDDDFSKVNDHISDLKDRFDDDLLHLTEDLDKKDFEKRVSLDKVTSDLKEAKDKIYKELREAALGINDARHGYKNDDRLLKKNILGKLNVLKQRVEEEVKEFNRKNTEAKDIFDGYFTALTEEIENLPKVKYYDEDIKEVRKEFKIGLDSLKILVEEIKGKQEVLKEEVNNRPIQPDPSEDTPDPLTPTDQNFATHEDLAKHYKLFVNRIQQQLYTIGGGGAGFIKDLDDVEFDQTTGTNKLLIYDGSQWVGIASTALSPIITLDDALSNGNVSGIGISVGVVTATNGYFSGIVTAAQLNYDVVTDIYSTGIVTATKGIQITTLGLNVASGISTLTDGLRVGSAATIYSNGNAAFSGIVTANGGFVGDGSGLTGVANTDNVVSTTLSVSGVVTAISGLYVGTAASIYANGNISAAGIVTASSFVGSGANITAISGSNIASGTVAAARVATLNQDTTGNAATATALETARAIGGVNFDGSAAINLPGVNASGSQDTSGNAATATILETTRAIGGVNFNGSAAINLPGVNESGNQNTSGTAAGLSGSPTITVAKVNVGTAATIHPTGGITAGIVTATSFVGPLTGNVTGNTSGSSGSCTGNAATATILATARNIGGVSFDGSAAINLPGVNQAGDQNTSGTSAGLTGTPNITVGDVVAASLDISGDADIDGTLEADAYTVNGTALDTHIAGVTVTNATNASIATNVTAADESSDTTCFPLFVTAATGNLPPKTGSNLAFNSSNGTLTASIFSGSGASLTNLPGVATESDTAVSTTSATTVATVDKTAYRAAFIEVVIVQSSAYQAGKYGLIHDGTTATIVEEFAIATGSMLGTFTATISGDNMLMQVNMGSSSSATVTVKVNTITV